MKQEVVESVVSVFTFRFLLILCLPVHNTMVSRCNFIRYWLKKYICIPSKDSQKISFSDKTEN